MDKSKAIALLHNEGMKLTQLSTQYLQQREQNSNEISFYSGETVTVETLQSELRRLAGAFPDITSDFMIILIERIIDNGFTTQRVRDAINNLIDNSPYKRPSIADIISYDRKVRVYTYNEIMEKCTPTYPAFEKYDCIEINGKKRYIEKS